MRSQHTIDKYISRNTESLQYFNTQEKNMLTQLAEYFQKMFQNFNKPQTYGSALEAYIMCHAPQNACDVDRLTRQFDMQQAGRNW